MSVVPYKRSGGGNGFWAVKKRIRQDAFRRLGMPDSLNALADWKDNYDRSALNWLGRNVRRIFTAKRRAKRAVAPKPKRIAVRRGGRKRRVTGYSTTGNYVGRFSRRGGRPNSRTYRACAVYKVEYGGTVSGDQVQYLGHHNMPFRQLWFAIWMSIVKAMAQQQGMDFDTFDRPVLESVADLFNIVVRYRDGEVDNNVSTATYTPSSGTIKWSALVTELAQFVMNLVSTTSVRFELLDMYMKNQTSTTAMIGSKKIRFKDMRISIKAVAKMKIQNETVSTTSGATGQDTYSAEDIRNNPLEGKYYDLYGNYAEPKYFEHDGLGDPNVLCAVADTGVMFVADDSANLTTGMQNLYDKVLPGGFFQRCGKTGRVTLAPGAIKHSTLITSKTMYFNSIVAALLPQLRATTTFAGALSSQPTKMGRSRLFGFEKMVDSRTTEPAITLGYDLDMTFITRCIGQNSTFTAPYTSVN